MLLLLISTAAAAETYRWVNEDGVVTYSQTPPPDAEAEVVKTRSAPSSDAAAEKKRLQKLRQRLADSEEDRALKKAEKQRLAEESAVNDRNCEAARNNLSQLTALGNRLYKVGDDYLRLTEEQRQQRMRDAREQIEKHCK